MGKARRVFTPSDQQKDSNLTEVRIYGILRKLRGGTAPAIGVGAGPITLTGTPASANLLVSNNHWTGQNEFEFACIHKLTCNLDANGKEITNLPTPQNCGDAATKCYVDTLFSLAGFNQSAQHESISESVLVWTDSTILYPTDDGILSISETSSVVVI